MIIVFDICFAKAYTNAISVSTQKYFYANVFQNMRRGEIPCSRQCKLFCVRTHEKPANNLLPPTGKLPIAFVCKDVLLLIQREAKRIDRGYLTKPVAGNSEDRALIAAQPEQKTKSEST